jgi:1,4-dihydroxy-6-naphthoate synthase
MAWANPDASRQFVLENAQEMDADVVRQHIDLYVNEFTLDLGPDGHAAADALLGRSAAAGITPAVRTLANG